MSSNTTTTTTTIDYINKAKELRKEYIEEFPGPWHGTPTPLVCACECGRFDDVKLMITGHDVNGSNGNNNNNMTLKEYVSQVGKDSDGYEYAPLTIAARNEHFQIAKYLVEIIYPHASKVEKKYYAEFPDGTPIVCACECGRFDDVKLMITGHDVNGSNGNNNNNMTLKEYVSQVSKDSYGTDRTPLMAAAENGHFQIVKYLIEQGEADPNIANSYGYNALHLAAGNNRTNTELTELLLTNMTLASINKKMPGGWTPLDKAYCHNDSPIRQEIIALLRSKGGKSNSYDENGQYVGYGKGDLNDQDNNGASPAINNNSNSSSNNNNNLVTTTTTTLTNVSVKTNSEPAETPETEVSFRSKITKLETQVENYESLIQYLKNEIKTLKKANAVELIDVDNNNNIIHITPPTGNSKKRKRSKDGASTMMVELEKNLKHFKEVKTEKIAIQSQLNEVQEDLVDERELLGMQTQTTDIWQGRFDKVYEIAKKMGADASVLNAIRDKPLTQGV